MKPLNLIALMFFGVAFASESLAESLECSIAPYELRVDGLVSAVGIDSLSPRFSWKLRAPETVHGARQTAWAIRVGETTDALALGKILLWNSGYVKADTQLHVPYGGPPLRSHQTAFWQVRVWDEHGRASEWSEPAQWTMGVLNASDWSPTKWVTDPELLKWHRAKLGFSSSPSNSRNTEKWLQLDLGSPQPLAEIRFYAVRHTVKENLGFPARFKVEVADDASFSAPKNIVDNTAKNVTGMGASVHEIDAHGARARFVRLTALQLRVDEGEARLAFSQVEVISSGKNIAPQAKVTASDSLEDDHWSTAAVVDGLGVPKANARANSTLLLRREFPVRAHLRRALLNVSGLGQYSLRLNGHPLVAGLLAPGWTDYEKTVLYDTYEITRQLQEGPNAAGVELAGGMYNVQEGRYTKFVSPFRPLMAMVRLRLEYEDGSLETIATDGAWRVLPGPTTFAHVFGGEDFDARLTPTGWDKAGFDDHSWTPATETEGPGGMLRGASASSPAFRTFETLQPIASRALRPGVTVYDLGQNASLMLHLRAHGSSGSRIKIIPAELVSPDGSVNRQSVGRYEASWNYTLSGDSVGEEWRPVFFYHGSRYLQVECTAATGGSDLPEVDLVEGLVAHSDSPPVGEFMCSDDLFNRVHTLVRWAQRSNLAHVITDCPHRERLGWLEQYHLNGPALRYEWDLARLYRKTFQDMVSAQQASGLIPDIAPEYVKFGGGFGDSPEWGSALILAAWQHWAWTGDDFPLREHYDAMRRYVGYLASKSKNHIVSHGLGDWYDVGPKPPGVAQLTPIALTATAIFYEDVTALSRIAALLGRKRDADELQIRADEIKTSFNEAFFNPQSGIYATGSQTAQSLPLVLGLVPQDRRGAVVEALVQDIHAHLDSVTAGDVGYRYLLRALADAGRSDVIFGINHQTEKPGYGYQLAHGATSLTEAWDARPSSSQNHFMLGQIIEWFYGNLAGLAPDPAFPGFSRVIVKPQPVVGIDWARARYESPRGPISVEWHRAGDGLKLELQLPPNTSAWVTLPIQKGARVLINQLGYDHSEDAQLVERHGSEETVEVKSGHYVFQTVAPFRP